MSSYRPCLVCGVSVKLENMSAHLRRVHPQSKVDIPTSGVGAGQIRSGSQLPGRRSRRKLLYVLLAIGLLVVPLAIYGLALTRSPTPTGNGVDPPFQVSDIEVFLQPTCGCCHQYLDYLGGNGFDVTPHEMADLSGIKASYGIPGIMQSCHTSVIAGYFVEGHVPIQAIQRLIEERPSVDGIALPGMPAGSPGMGGVKAAPFVIYALEGGQATVFMEI